MGGMGMNQSSEQIARQYAAAARNKKMWGNIIYNVGDFDAKGDGLTDDTAAIQSAIDTVSDAITSAYSNDFQERRGIVFVPPGKYRVGNLIMRSNVHIIGGGMYLTLFMPIGTSGYVFGVTGTNTNDRLANVLLQGFTIAPSNKSFVNPMLTGRSPMGGVDFSYTTHCHMKDVQMFNLEGIGFHLVEAFDGFIEDCTWEFVGKDVNTPATALYEGTNDLTNAMKFIGCRWENCYCMLRISGHGTNLSPRDNQFVACKFEWGSFYLPKTSPGIIIENSINQCFDACMFVTKENAFPLIAVGTATSDVRGLRLVGCSVTSPVPYNGWFIDVGLNAPAVQITSLSATGMNKVITGTNVIVNGLEAYDCNTPMIDVTESVLNGVISGATGGTDYCIRIQNQCIITDFRFNGKTQNVSGILVWGQDNQIDNIICKTGLNGVSVTGTGNFVGKNYQGSVLTPIDITAANEPFNFINYGVTGSSMSPLSTDKRYQTRITGSDIQYYDARWWTAQRVYSGPTANRPTGKDIGYMYLDLTINKTVWYYGSNVWRDAMGTTV